MAWIARILAIGIVLAAGMGSAQAPARRIALVIGNGAYQVPAWRLANPPRDAALMGERLRSLGFEVDLAADADRRAMEAAFVRFGQRLRAAGPQAVGLFYYAGHGAQKDGVNLLIPTDASARTMDELRFQAPAMQFLLSDMAAAANSVNILILDACRDIPLEEGLRGGDGGLADVGRIPNVFIAYAAAPGRTARDGAAGNSPFTAALAQALAAQPGDPLALLFADVQERVFKATGGAQSPEYRNGLVQAGRWSFAVARPTSPSPATPLPSGVDRRTAAINALLAPVSLVGDAPAPSMVQDYRDNAGDSVFFGFEEAILRADAQVVLDKQARWLLAHPGVRARVYGNADPREGADAVLIGAQRAKAVRDYLLGCGVPPDQVGSTTYGLDRPLTPQTDEAAWAMARRVETRLVSVTGATRAAPTSAAVPFDLALLHPDVRRAAEHARAFEQRAVAAASRALQAAAQAENAARRAEAEEAGYRDHTYTTNGVRKRYRGGWTNGRQSGYGVEMYLSGESTGSSYAGGWTDGVPNGVGVFQFVNGFRYEGELESDSINGVGILTWRTANRTYDRYAGGLLKGRSCLSGVTIKPDGVKFEGDYGDGETGKTGHGVEWDAQGRLLRQGVWTRGALTTPLQR